MASRRSPDIDLANPVVERPSVFGSGSFSKTGLKVGSFRRSFARNKEASRRAVASSKLHLIVDDVEVGVRHSVTFELDENEYYEPERNKANKCDLWWTREELLASRAEGKLSVSTDKGVQAYLKAFDSAYRMVKADSKITSDVLKDVVHGLSLGHRGLEDAVTREDFARKNADVKKYVAAVLKHYSDCNKKERASFRKQESVRNVNKVLRTDSVRSIDSTDSSSFCGNMADRSVRNFSRKLTTGDRNFSQSMGRAEKLAASSSKKSSEIQDDPPNRSALDASVACFC